MEVGRDGGREKSQVGSESGSMGDSKEKRQLSQPYMYTYISIHTQKDTYTHRYTYVYQGRIQD